MSRRPRMATETAADVWIGDETQISVVRFDAACFLIRNLLSLADQTELFEYIQQNDETPRNQPRPMVPAPKTLLLGEDGNPNIKYAFGDVSIVNRMVEKGCEVLRTKNLNVVGGFDVCRYKSLSMATIQYEAPDGHFPPHVDHCDDSFVFLASLGCTANFFVKAPAMASEKNFKFCSGDMLVFDASSKAAILHSVVSIDEASSRAGESLGSKFPILQNHRYGVQCRMHF